MLQAYNMPRTQVDRSACKGSYPGLRWFFCNLSCHIYLLLKRRSNAMNYYFNSAFLLSFSSSIISSDIFWISVTISGFANVVVSPTSLPLDMAASTLRMIFPERVFGISGTIQTFLGLAILPMESQRLCEILAANSGLCSYPGFRETYRSGDHSLLYRQVQGQPPPLPLQ